MDYDIRDDDMLALVCRLDRETLCHGKILMQQGTVARYLKCVEGAYDAGVMVARKRLTPIDAVPYPYPYHRPRP